MSSSRMASSLANSGLVGFLFTRIGFSRAWCERGDSNSYAVKHQILSLACLPVSPLSLPSEGPCITTCPGHVDSFLLDSRALSQRRHGKIRTFVKIFYTNQINNLTRF